MRYKIGDVVLVLENLEPYEPYGYYCIAPIMKQWEGAAVRITDIIDGPFYPHRYYRIAEDGGAWKWTDEMFSGLLCPETDPIDSFDFDVTEMLEVM